MKMIRLFTYCITIAVVSFCQQNVSAQVREKFLPLPSGQIALNTGEGRQVLVSTEFQEGFWQLSQFFNTQQDLGSCGVATSLMVLNPLDVPRPRSATHGEYPFFTVENLFSDQVRVFLTPEKVAKSGMTLDQLGRLLEVHGANVKVQHASESSVDGFRQHLKNSLSKKNNFIVINYLRSAIGQSSGGHISPIAAFSPDRDMVLIMDTSSYKYPWTWVPVDSIWEAMRRDRDSESMKSRGYLVVTGKSHGTMK